MGGFVKTECTYCGDEVAGEPGVDFAIGAWGRICCLQCYSSESEPAEEESSHSSSDSIGSVWDPRQRHTENTTPDERPELWVPAHTWITDYDTDTENSGP